MDELSIQIRSLHKNCLQNAHLHDYNNNTNERNDINNRSYELIINIHNTVKNCYSKRLST